MIINRTTRRLIGRNLRILRLEAGLLAPDVAAATGICKETITSIERGDCGTLQQIRKTAAFYGKKMEDLAYDPHEGLYSLLQDDLGVCCGCGEFKASIFPIFPQNTEACLEHGLMAALCEDCNVDPIKRVLQRRGQKVFEQIYGTKRFQQEFKNER